MEIFRMKYYKAQIAAEKAAKKHTNYTYKTETVKPNRASKMIEIDHLLGLRREEKEFIDPYYYLDEDFS